MGSNYTLRYVANIVFEAATPLKVGSSDIDMLQDSPIQKDWNELPMVLGTSIAGVLRKEFDATFANDIFGDEDGKKKDNKGSRVIISNALLCDKDMQVIERLMRDKNEFLKIFENLPIREHTKITSKGVADSENSGKFDEEVVYKGTRFKFRMELIADENDEANWNKLLRVINSNIFRLGGGTTKGFGDIKIVRELSSYGVFALDSEEYREKSSSLNTPFSTPFSSDTNESDHYTHYTLNITPDDFFMFGSGFEDDDADMTPVFEQVVDYSTGNLSSAQVLIPASSIKGAVAHRVAFHYNTQMLKEGKDHTQVGEKNKAVKAIFGHKKELAEDKKTELGQKGKLLISDCFKKTKAQTKTFDHVSIDRFTGGGIDGALFQEKTIANDKEPYEIEILLEKSVGEDEVKAFEQALRDITTGMLPLGGATTKGHGVFSGTVLKEGEKL